eukprot:jgi/Psemu1/18205/gm1.18205_g
MAQTAFSTRISVQCIHLEGSVFEAVPSDVTDGTNTSPSDNVDNNMPNKGNNHKDNMLKKGNNHKNGNGKPPVHGKWKEPLRNETQERDTITKNKNSQIMRKIDSAAQSTKFHSFCIIISTTQFYK